MIGFNMKKMILAAFAMTVLATSSLNAVAGETCKVSMMGRICYNEDGSLRGESATVAKTDKAEKEKVVSK